MLRVLCHSLMLLVAAQIPALAGASARETNQSIDSLRDYELSVYEELLAQQIGLRSPSNFNLLRDEYGRRADNHQEELRHQTWLAILRQKLERRTVSNQVLAKSSDPWLKQIALNLNPARRERSLASSETCAESSQKFLEDLDSSAWHTRLRWVSLAQVFGEKCVGPWLRTRFRVMDSLESISPAPKADLEKLALVLVGFEPKEANALRSKLEELKIPVRIQPISSFSRMEEKASELKNTLQAEPGTKTIIISSHSGGAVVLALLDQYPYLKRSGDLLGWIGIDTWLKHDGEQVSFSKATSPLSLGALPKRAPAMAAGELNAQVEDLADFSRFMTTSVNVTGDGFHAYSISTRNSFASLMQTLVPEAQNLSTQPESVNKFLLEILDRGFGIKSTL